MSLLVHIPCWMPFGPETLLKFFSPLVRFFSADAAFYLTPQQGQGQHRGIKPRPVPVAQCEYPVGKKPGL